MLAEIQDIVRAVMSASSPTELVDGLVLTAAPDITIQVGVEKSFVIDKDQIIISQRLLPHTQSMEIVKQEYKTSENGTYTPIWIRGDIGYTDTLQPGETVLMLKYNSGQNYYVIDRGVSYGADT